jgi:AcrR family transcriptional regulator
VVTQQERSERTREHILRTAAREFATRGYAGTSLNAIVRTSGLTKGAFYHHFASKQELALATFRHEQLRLIEAVAPAAEGNGDIPSALRELFRARARVLQEDPSTRAVLTLGAEFRANPDPTFVDQQEAAFELLAGLVGRGQREGSLRSDVDPRAAAELLFAAMVGMDDVSRFMSGLEDLGSRSDLLLELLINGLRSGGAPRRKGKR